MKSLLNDIFGSQSTEGKLAVNTALEALIDVEVTQPAKDELFGESVELVEKVVATHDDDNVREAAGQLLKALVMTKGVDETLISTVSQEGLGSFITRIKNAVQGRDEHGVKASDKKPGTDREYKDRYWSDEGKKALKELKDAITKFYLNDNWLNGQTFVEGTVSATNIAEHLQVDGKLDQDPFKTLEKGIHNAKEASAKWFGVVKELEHKVSAIDDQVKKETKGAALDDKEAVKKVEAAISKMEKLVDIFDKLPRMASTSCGNRILGVHVYKTGKSVEAITKPEIVKIETMPALDKNGVKEAAKWMVKLLENEVVEWKWLGWLDHSDGSEFNDWIYDADNDVYMRYYDYFYHQGANRMYAEGPLALFDEYEVVYALARWIDRSIK